MSRSRHRSLAVATTRPGLLHIHRVARGLFLLADAKFLHDFAKGGSWGAARKFLLVSVGSALVGALVLALFQILGLVEIAFLVLAFVILVEAVYIFELRSRLEETEVDYFEEGARFEPPSAERKEELCVELKRSLSRTYQLRRFQVPLRGKERAGLVRWQKMTAAYLEEALGPDSSEFEEFETLQFEPPLGGLLGDPGTALQKALDEAQAILRTALQVRLKC